MKKTLKLESLNDSKFEAFKGMEVNNPLKVIGGAQIATKWTLSGTDLKGKDTFYTQEDQHMSQNPPDTYFGQTGDMKMYPGIVGGPEPVPNPSYEFELEQQ